MGPLLGGPSPLLILVLVQCVLILKHESGTVVGWSRTAEDICEGGATPDRHTPPPHPSSHLILPDHRRP